MDIRLFTKVAKLNLQVKKCWCSNGTSCDKWVEIMHCKKGDEAVLYKLVAYQGEGDSFTGRAEVLGIPHSVHQDHW
jgi:hypothetical protein